MPKRVVKHPIKKRTSSKKITAPKRTTLKRTKINEPEKNLAQNFASLQKVMVNLSSKFDNLAKQISQLLKLFEISAKTLAEKELDMGKPGNKKMMEKMNILIEQNKIIARGLTMVHDRISEKPETPTPPPMPVPKQPMDTQKQPMQTQPRINPQKQGMRTQEIPKPQEMEGYQKSISSKSPAQLPTTPPKK